jgi:diguanylate cyclase (GGDEF)-like protein
LLSEIEVQKTYLEKRNTQLEKLRVELLESRNNWKYLGENIPSQVFIFNNDFEIEFSNTINFEIPGYLDLEFLRGFAVETFSKKKNIKKKINYKKDLWLELYCVFEDEEDHSKVMIIISDISENVEYQNKIEYLGFNDLLTGLRNRHYFMINKSELLQSDNYPISVIVGDVEGLKLINDVFGHEYGDQLLKRSAEIFNSIDNSGKSCIRWGGDEFVLLIPNTGDEASIKIIDQLDNEFRSIDIDGIIQFGVSLGYSIIKSSDKPFFEAFKQAEDRMYLNKLSHRNREKSNILDTLHTTLLQKNYETAEHTQRMSELGIEFGHYLGLKNHEIDILATLLTIHDIGKISIDKAILEKPTKLNEVEWEQIRKHSEIGFRLCSTIPELLANADAILSHHERWDGFGYPQGLKGEEIPFMARMICVIDSFDVMTHKRVYKKAMTVGNALVEIEKCSGTQFDPLLAANFIEFMSNK